MEQTPAEQTAGAVRAEMARRQIKGRQLARDLNWKHNTLSRRLNGQYPFTINELVAVADYLGVPLVDLLPGRDTAAA